MRRFWSRLCGLPASALRFFTDLVTPFATIARELRRMNDLKTLELSERLNPKTGEPSPVIPLTEHPSKSDTEVFFPDEPEGRGPRAQASALARLWQNEVENEEDREEWG